MEGFDSQESPRLEQLQEHIPPISRLCGRYCLDPTHSIRSNIFATKARVPFVFPEPILSIFMKNGGILLERSGYYEEFKMKIDSIGRELRLKCGFCFRVVCAVSPLCSQVASVSASLYSCSSIGL